MHNRSGFQAEKRVFSAEKDIKGRGAMDKVKVVILCGGLGTRLREETEFRPKPMVTIGDKPILWHIMKIYANYGFNDFVLCLGYKGEMIKEFFYHYELLNNDFTVELGNNNHLEIYNRQNENGWRVTLADTGHTAMTGSRIKRIEKYVDTDIFMLTYGDGLSDINLESLLKYHKSHKKIGTVTAVHPQSRYGELLVEKNSVIHYSEKPQMEESLVNGGFFVFNKYFFEYLDAKDDCALEKKPLEKLSADGELMVYHHEGFWQSMDTFRDLQLLNNLWNSGQQPWKVWE